MAKSKRSRPDRDISPTRPDAAAIDIGSRTHVAAVPPDRDIAAPVRSFGTCTGDLQRLADWFECCGVRTVAMESTGVYWIPVYEILDQRGFEVMLVKPETPSMCPAARPTSATPSGCGGCTNMGCCEPAFGPRASWLRCVLICASVNACSTTLLRISSTCRRR